jgi:hypothetical protein
LGLSEDLQLQREKVQKLKFQWKRMWYERVDDQWRAEGIANETYPLLFVDRGTIIRATRDFKALSLKEILELHQITNLARYIPPDPAVGGWTRFVKTHITTMKRLHGRNSAFGEPEPERKRQQLKKGGRGWLHR